LHQEGFIFVSYSQIAVFDRALERPFNEWTEKHVIQGFSWRPENVAFATVEEGGQHVVEVAIDFDQREPSRDVVRIIDVPFEVPNGGDIEIASISDGLPLNMQPGSYQLRFEYCKPTEARPPKIRFQFKRDDKPVFAVVRTDADRVLAGSLILTASPA